MAGQSKSMNVKADDKGSEGVRMGVEQEYARKYAAERADAWTTRQAARLATSPAVILDAIKRGWLPEQIENISNKYALESSPPAGICFTVV